MKVWRKFSISGFGNATDSFRTGRIVQFHGIGIFQIFLATDIFRLNTFYSRYDANREWSSSDSATVQLFKYFYNVIIEGKSLIAIHIININLILNWFLANIKWHVFHTYTLFRFFLCRKPQKRKARVSYSTLAVKYLAWSDYPW
jgi:hypothetical protein